MPMLKIYETQVIGKHLITPLKTKRNRGMETH